jgi:DNA-binding NarL/FixJ family response regulator
MTTITRGNRRPTARQLEVIDLMSRPGATQPEVAEALGIEVSTIKAHLQAAYTRLGVRTLAQAVRAVHGRRTRAPAR